MVWVAAYNGNIPHQSTCLISAYSASDQLSANVSGKAAKDDPDARNLETPNGCKPGLYKLYLGPPTWVSISKCKISLCLIVLLCIPNISKPLKTEHYTPGKLEVSLSLFPMLGSVLGEGFCSMDSFFLGCPEMMRSHTFLWSLFCNGMHLIHEGLMT